MLIFNNKKSTFKIKNWLKMEHAAVMIRRILEGMLILYDCI